MNGLYLAAPHGSLIHSGEKTTIAAGRRYSIEGERLVCSKEDGKYLAFGVAYVGDPEMLDPKSFDSRVSRHCVSKKDRKRWWPDANCLYEYPILLFIPFPSPMEAPIKSCSTMNMGEVSLSPEIEETTRLLLGKKEKQIGELVIMSSPDRIMSSGEKEDKMPWTTADPPRPAKNWTADEKKKCVAAANAAIRDDPEDEQGAIFACIRAAGKTQHPGGKKEAIDPEDYVIATELIDGFKAVWNTAYVNTLPDSCFLYVESGNKDDEGKTVPRSKRHFPYKDASGKVDLPHLRNAIQRVPTSTAPGLNKATVQKRAQAILAREQGKKALEEAEVDFDSFLESLKAGDMGDGDTHTCTCPNCGTQVEKELRSPCREETCPKCGARMRGGDDSTESAKEEAPAEEEEKAGRRINSSVMTKLKDLLAKLKEVIDWGDSVDKQPVAQIASQVGKAYSFKSLGDDWFIIWPTNSYQDRDGEFFTSAALKDFVDRHETDEVKGEAWFWHVPGSKFGTIYHQAVVEENFVAQLGKYDPTSVGKAFKEFFSRYPDGHPKIAPWGWGASHGFAYVQADREHDGTFRWFDIKESTVLPVHYAANPFNPSPRAFKEVAEMNDKQKEAFEEIGKLVGVPDLVDQIVASARLKKEQLDGSVEHKSVKPEDDEEQVPPEEEKKEGESLAPSLTPEVVAMIAEALQPAVSGPAEDKSTEVSQVTKEIVESLQLGNLSDMLTSIVNEVKEIKGRLDHVEQDDKTKVKELHDMAFQPAWFVPSKADENVQNPSTPNANVQSGVPETVKAIAGRIEDSI